MSNEPSAPEETGEENASAENDATEQPAEQAETQEETTTPDAAEAASEGEEATTPSGADYASDRKFRDFPIAPELVRGIEEHGYLVATPVQAATIEPALAEIDLVVRSKTGTGKTTAFGVPIIARSERSDNGPHGIVLTPTRELALQVSEELGSISRHTGVRVFPIYGGVAIGPQTKALEEGVDVVVGTPGRILDHMRQGNLSLANIRIACLDEADEMLSMGFLEEVTGILGKLPDGHQTLLFSATVNPAVKALINRYLNEPENLMLSTDADRVENIDHVVYEMSGDTHRVRNLAAILDKENPESALIFCNTRSDTSTVAAYLNKQGFDCTALSGDMAQNKREQAMRKVKQGESQFLVATDVASRGIDISDLSHVFHYSLPADPAVYLHRSGRTGRIGKQGQSIALASGGGLGTKRVLETQFGITFETRELPTPEEAAELRATREIRFLKAAMATMPFEGYLPSVRAIKERPEGDILLAVALRAFFIWDRQRRAGASADTGERRDDAEGREGRGRRGRDDSRGRGGNRGRGRGRGRDRDRGERGGGRGGQGGRRDASERSDSEPRSEGGDEGGKRSDGRRRRRRRGNRNRNSERKSD